MIRNKIRSQASRPSQFVPRLERYEVRFCPAVTVAFDSGVLTITGDAAANTVIVAVEDDQVRVRADGKTQTFEGSLEEVTADLQGGADRLIVNLGEVSNDQIKVSAKLGAGADVFRLMAEEVGSDAELTVDVTGNGGDDRAIIELGEIGRGATVDVSADLGAGADVFRMMADEVGRDAKLSVDVNAGGGDDRVVLNLGEVGRDGEANITVNLGAGRDVLVATLGGAGKGATVNVDVNGGGGRDRAVFQGANSKRIDVDVDNVEIIAGLKKNKGND
jgi:hypothetical protein